MTEQGELDDSAARSEILSKVRALKSKPNSHADVARANAMAYMARHDRGPKPYPCADVVDLFVTRAKDMLSTVSILDSEALVAQECRRYLDESGITTEKVSIWPSLSGLDWSALKESIGASIEFGAPTGSELLGISGVAYALAETGTLVFSSLPDDPASTHLLPETHIAIVKAEQVVHSMEDVFERMRVEGRAMPRALNFVSGPSRTADIEQTIVLGAHGPYRVHVILIRANP
ncbi:MAG: LUD domain-containing protein [Limnobacter sp.]|nr:LUD domain-containing protein [Limnobacter sp.]